MPAQRRCVMKFGQENISAGIDCSGAATFPAFRLFVCHSLCLGSENEPAPFLGRTPFRQQDYKPSSVSRFLQAKPAKARRRPSIWDHDYSQPLATNPRAGRAAYSSPIWSCSEWCLPSRPVTRPLVRSYRTVSPLPLRCRKGGLSLWHYPSRRRAWALPSTLPFGARTFLPRIHQGGRPSSCLT